MITDAAGDERCLVAPENVTSRWLQQGGLNISWTQQRHQQQARCQFVVEYRTVGQWVPLTQTLTTTWYRWSTASRGAVYHFRVISLDHSNSLRSPPSRPVSIETGGRLHGEIGVATVAETVSATVATTSTIITRKQILSQREQHVSYTSHIFE